MKNGEWKKARIIECRLSVKKGAEYDPNKKKNEDSYDYYVHYENQNRRLDEWVSRERINMV